MTAAAINITLTTISNVLVTGIFLGATASPNVSFDGVIVNLHGNYNGSGGTLEGGVDLVYQNSTHSWFFAATSGFGTNPLGTLPASRAGKGLGYTLAAGPIFNMRSPQDMAGISLSAVWPVKLLPLIQGALFNRNKAWGALAQFAKNVHNVDFSHVSVGFGVADSGASFATFAFRSNIFGTFAFGDTEFFPVSGSGFQGFFNDMRSRLGLIFSTIEGGLFSGSAQMQQGADRIAGAIQAGDNAVQ